LVEDSIMTPDKLYKTTIIIWSDFDPVLCEIDYLAREAISGDTYCSEKNIEIVSDTEKFPQTDFFGTNEESEYE
jgi:hypothetical protein